mmetsp:Transcript_46173/g.100536  ORF Transcript_46173/g.100536 Transcript_46173/m.100536 type:complete len:234 (+) Transcript_46173:1045-1746(+)
MEVQLLQHAVAADNRPPSAVQDLEKCEKAGGGVAAPKHGLHVRHWQRLVLEEPRKDLLASARLHRIEQLGAGRVAFYDVYVTELHVPCLHCVVHCHLHADTCGTRQGRALTALHDGYRAHDATAHAVASRVIGGDAVEPGEDDARATLRLGKAGGFGVETEAPARGGKHTPRTEAGEVLRRQHPRAAEHKGENRVSTSAGLNDLLLMPLHERHKGRRAVGIDEAAGPLQAEGV